MRYSPEVKKRFAGKTQKQRDCLIWSGAKDKDGYGFFRYEGKNYRAHRFAVMLEGQEITPLDTVCHSCDNPSCVNIDHLWVGTAQCNALDSGRKGRRHGQKLTFDDAEQIRERFSFGERAVDLAAEFGVGRRHIYNITSGKNLNYAC